jgi:CheY-like chemotaxis protein
VLARTTTPDAIVLDLNLPDMPGRDVLNQLKHDPATAHIPVILVSSQPISDRDRAGWAESAAAVISKHHLTRDVLQHSLTSVLAAAGETRA